MMMPTPRIFISYSHDSAAHKTLVLTLANRLRDDGLNCQIDQYINGFPPEGWQRWMETQVEQADFVLLVCTPTYLRRYRGQERNGGRGVTFEGVVISQWLYDYYYHNTKFVPLIPDAGTLEDVPLPLKGFGAFRIMAEYEGLYRYLTGQAAVVMPPIGEIKKLRANIDQVVDNEFPDTATATKRNVTDSLLSNEALVRELRQKSDYIDLLTEQIACLKKNQERALADNAEDQRGNPENPLLVAERQALQVFDLKRAAELREQYYQALRQERRAKIVEMQAEMAREAFVSAERWEGAFNMPKALTLYQEAVEFKADYFEAWRKITDLAKKVGNYKLSLQAARQLQQQLDPKTDQWWLAVAYSDEADALVALGDNSQACERYIQAHYLFQELCKTDPENIDWQRDLSVSYERVGDMQQVHGDGEAALKAYEESLAIRKYLVALNPKHTQWQRDLSLSYERVGSMYRAAGNNKAALKAYQDGLAITKHLVALDPNHTGWQRDLSLRYDRVGDMHKVAGDGKSALKAYQDGLAIAKRLVALDPKHTGWQRDLSVSHNNIGDMHKVIGDSESALKAYEESLAIRQRLAALDPNNVQWQRDLAVSYKRVGDMHKAAGNGEVALKAYEDSLTITKQLVELDPQHTEWQRDLSVSYECVGDMHRAAGDGESALQAYKESLTIRKHLVALDPEYSLWQRDLSVSYERVGDMEQAAGDNVSALQAYEESLTIRKYLAALDPQHTQWQRDLSLSYDRTGDMHKVAGDRESALKAYKGSLAIRECLAALDPNHVQWQTDLVVSYVKLSQVQPAKQKQLLSAALAILKKLHAANKLDYETQGWIPMLEDAINQQ